MAHKIVINAEELPEGKRSLRSVLSSRFPNGMPEDRIALVLKGVTEGLNHIKSVHGGAINKEPEVDAGRIAFDWSSNVEDGQDPCIIELAYHENYMKRHRTKQPNVGIHGVGILPLELIYGSLPENRTPAEMNTLGENMVKFLKQKLEDDDGQKLIKKLPITLDQSLLDDDYIEKRQRRKEESKKAKKIAGSYRGKDYPKKYFSRGFLEFLLKCLDFKANPTGINQILELPFLQISCFDGHENVVNTEQVPQEMRLRSILRNHFSGGVSEEGIWLLLKGTLRGLKHIVTVHGCRGTEPVRNSGRRPDVGIRGVGILALELAYGSLPENLTPRQMVVLGKNMVALLKMKLVPNSSQKTNKKLPHTLRVLLDDDYISRRQLHKVAKKNAGGVDSAGPVFAKGRRS
ncbi:OLC1v1014519C1 [Oldenlandia corymbosa var. corymbosa]|uniref:OLC1v1014519C1 n=1 Tax=Oldenlandia corymbosa var. corymbosa TaxID=529605 RepID=A0AAV1E4B8_OLDCO|nr:OLC1v1014519C1 [Oldenlandia corymbosa var. corymbosa]